MTTSLFSVYNQRENRVTATFLAVLERLSLPNMDRILQALLEDREFRLVTFVNQPKGRSSRPDAKIHTSPAVWVETKTVHNSVSYGQIKNHLRSLGSGEKLLLLTPDESRPSSLDSRVAWSNFHQLVNAVQVILDDEFESPSEKESFLLRELIRMVKDTGLVTPTESRVLVRAATEAWPAYEEFCAYHHLGDPSFRPSGYFAFYLGNEVKPIVAKIKSVIKSITLDDPSQVELLDVEPREFVEKLKARWSLKKHKITQKMQEGFQYHFARPTQWMFLSSPDDEETVKLANPVKNVTKSKSGRGTAFTQNRRYVTLESLKRAHTTSDLEPG